MDFSGAYLQFHEIHCCTEWFSWMHSAWKSHTFVVYLLQNGTSWNWSLWIGWEFLETGAEIYSGGWGGRVDTDEMCPLSPLGGHCQYFPSRANLHVLIISNSPTTATAQKKGEHTVAELLLPSRVLSSRRQENLSVRCPLVLIRQVTECLTLDRWQITGKPFRNDLC